MTPDEDLSAAADRILAGFDYAQTATLIEQTHRREVAAILSDVIAVVDSLEQLEQQCGDSDAGSPQAWAMTVRRIHRQVVNVLVRAGVTRLECLGKPVDVNTCEVVDVRRGTGEPEDTVVEEVLRGYAWRGRLLRQPRVIIAGEPAQRTIRNDAEASNREQT